MKKYRHLRGTLFDIERELRSRNSGADEAISEAFVLGDNEQARTSVVSGRSSVSSTASKRLHKEVHSGVPVRGKDERFNEFKKVYEITSGQFRKIAEEIFESARKNGWLDKLKITHVSDLIPLAPYMIFNRRKKGVFTGILENARNEEKVARRDQLEKPTRLGRESWHLSDFYQGPEYHGEGLLPPNFIEADEKDKGKMLEDLIGKIFQEAHRPKNMFGSGASQIIIEPAFERILKIFKGWGMDYNFVAPANINDKVILESFSKAEASDGDFASKAKAFIQAIEGALGMKDYWLPQYVVEPTTEEEKKTAIAERPLKPNYQSELSIYTIEVTHDKLKEKYHVFRGGEGSADAREWIPLGVTTGGIPEAGIPKMKLEELQEGLGSGRGYTLTKHTVTMNNEQFIMKDTKSNLEQENSIWNVVSSGPETKKVVENGQWKDIS